MTVSSGLCATGRNCWSWGQRRRFFAVAAVVEPRDKTQGRLCVLLYLRLWEAGGTGLFSTRSGSYTWCGSCYTWISTCVGCFPRAFDCICAFLIYLEKSIFSLCECSTSVCAMAEPHRWWLFTHTNKILSHSATTFARKVQSAAYAHQFLST